MQIDYINYTPVASFIGGVLIGLSSVFLFFMFGRIAGISGIVGGFLKFSKNDTLWRFYFLLGIILSGSIFYRFIDTFFLELLKYS